MTWTAEKEARWTPVFDAYGAAASAREAKLDAGSGLQEAIASGSGAAIMVAGAIYDQRSAEHEGRYQAYLAETRIAEAAEQEAEAGQ
jgi:hypothetical protein